MRSTSPAARPSPVTTLACALFAVAPEVLARTGLVAVRAAIEQDELSLLLADSDGLELTVYVAERNDARAAFGHTAQLSVRYRSSREHRSLGPLLQRAMTALDAMSMPRLRAIWTKVLAAQSTAAQPPEPAAQDLLASTGSRFGDAALALRFGDTACGMMGALETLAEIRGDFAVVVHGDRACLPTSASGGTRVFSSDLTDMEVMGGGEARLLQVVRLVVERTKASAVVLVSTCLSQMIGDDLDLCASQLEEELSMAVLAIKATGLEPLRPVQVIDRVYGAFARRFLTDRAAETDEVAFVGYPPFQGHFDQELRQLLARAGVGIGGVWPRDGVDALPRLAGARAVFAPERVACRTLLERLESLRKGQVAILATPIGLEPTRSFYREVGARMARETALAAELGPLQDRCAERIAKARERFQGVRVAAVFGATRKGASLESTVHLGIGYVPFLRELGLEPVLVALTQDSAEQRARLRALAWSLGAAPGVHTYQRPELLPELVAELRPALVVVEDCQKHHVDAAQVAYMGFRQFGPGFAGIERALDTLEAILP